MSKEVLQIPDRAALVLEWRRSGLTQSAFLARLEADRGIRVSPRTLRAWANRIRSSRSGHEQLEEVRALVEQAREHVREIAARLDFIAKSLADSGPPTAQRQPTAAAAAELRLQEGTAAAAAPSPGESCRSRVTDRQARPLPMPTKWDFFGT
jgi:hypothetical protein